MATAPLRFLMILSGYPPAARGGAERGCQRLSEALARRGHRVLVLTQRAAGHAAVTEEAPGLTVHRIVSPVALGPLWGATYMLQIKKAMRALADDWDFALCHELYLHSAVSAAVARDLGKHTATLLVNAGEWSDIARLGRHTGGRSLVGRALLSDALFALSRQSARELAEAGVERGRVWRYDYFVDADRFAPRESPPSREFLYLGRFNEMKNIPLLVQAFGDVWSREPRARLRLVGAGEAEADVRAAVDASPARAAIAIDPWSADPAAEFRRACTVVTASNSEGLSNVLIEAMACGAPVVTTDVSGARDALDRDMSAPTAIAPGRFWRGCGGLIAPIRDHAALAAAMLHVVSDDGDRAALAREARQRVLEQFTEEVSVQRFLDAVGYIRSGAKPPASAHGFPESIFASGTAGA